MEPFFQRDRIAKEIQSIQFEFEDTLNNEDHRFTQLRKLNGEQKHEFSKFLLGTPPARSL